MKIALLGAGESGKTVYFSALYHRYRNVIAIPVISEIQKAYYVRNRIRNQVGFRLRIDSTDLDAKLSANAARLMQRPITRWPEKTHDLQNAQLEVQFDFVPIAAERPNPMNRLGADRSASRSYQRSIELYDPPGEAFQGMHQDSSNIVAQLETCDIAIVFFPANEFLDAISSSADEPGEDELVQVLSRLTIGKITEVLKKMKANLEASDIFPVCFIVSKFDQIPQEKIDIINKLVYNYIIMPFSEENPEFMICVCPVSVVDPTTHNFKAQNLEWPFLFATGGTIFRNSQDLRKEAKSEEDNAAKAAAKAKELLSLRKRSYWDRFRRWVDDGFVTVGSQQRAASAYRNSAGRKVMSAASDAEFARDVWSSIEAEGKERGVYVLIGGKNEDPRIATV